MGKESGIKVLLYVGDGKDSEVFTVLAGQQDTRMSGSANSVDVSDKTTGGWGSSISGTRNMTVTATGIADWPDEKGLGRLADAWRTGSVVNCELIVNEAGDKWTGSFSVTQFDSGGGHDSATDYSITLQNSGEPQWVTG